MRKDVNGIYYINANLPAAQSTFAGVDTRPRWVGTPCAATATPADASTRINSRAGQRRRRQLRAARTATRATSWNIAQTFSKTTELRAVGARRLQLRRLEDALRSRVDGRDELRAQQPGGRSEQSRLQHSMWSPGHRVFALVNYTRQYFGFGSDLDFAVLGGAAQHGRAGSSRFSYVFAGDMNGDGVTRQRPDLHPAGAVGDELLARSPSARAHVHRGEQATAFEAYIQQDKYLREHRGQYAERNGVVHADVQQHGPVGLAGYLPQLRRPAERLPDPARHPELRQPAEQRLGRRPAPVAAVNTNNQLQILTNPGVDAQGRATYRLAVVNNELIKNTFQTSAGTGDV